MLLPRTLRPDFPLFDFAHVHALRAAVKPQGCYETKAPAARTISQGRVSQSIGCSRPRHINGSAGHTSKFQCKRRAYWRMLNSVQLGGTMEATEVLHKTKCTAANENLIAITACLLCKLGLGSQRQTGAGLFGGLLKPILKPDRR